MIDFDTRPSEHRGFIHKKLIGAALSFIPGGGLADAALSVIRPRPGSGTPRPSKFTAAELSGTLEHLRHGHTAVDAGHGWLNPGLVRAARSSVVTGHVPSGVPPGFAALPPGTGGCIPPFRRDPRTGDCRIFLGEQSGVDDTPVGEAIMGRFGPALTPGSKIIDRALCLKGMVLGLDGLCYNSRGEGRIANKNRMWPKGPQPLGTAEEMRAVRISTRFGRRFERTKERLQALGVVKKPAPRARRKKAVKQIGPGITVIDTE